MNKKFAVFVVLLFGLVVCAQASVFLRLFGGYATMPGEKTSEAPAIGGSVGFGLSPAFSLEITAGRWVFPLRGSEAGLSQGRLTEIPIELELRARFSLGGKSFGPYAAGGLGYALHSFALDAGFADGWRKAGFEVNEQANHGLAVHIGAGVEIALGPAVTFDLGARYSFLRSKGSWTMADLASGESMGGPLNSLNFDALAVTAGFRVAFR